MTTFKHLKSYIIESLSINEAANAEEKELKKWFKAHNTNKMKLQNGKICLMGKTNSAENQITFNSGETNVPDFVEFDDWKTTCALWIDGQSLETVSFIPAPEDYGDLHLSNCSNLKDFDADFSKAKPGGMYFDNCLQLSSFSGLEKCKSKVYLHLNNLPNLKSLKSLNRISDLNISEIKNCGLKNLEGYRCDTASYQYGTNIESLPNLESLDGAIWPKDAYSIGIADCPKLSTLGNADLSKAKIRYINFYNCPKVGRTMLEDILEKVNFEEKLEFYSIAFTNTGVDKNKDKDLLKKLNKKSGLEITVNGEIVYKYIED